jgi:hypothetical protein
MDQLARVRPDIGATVTAPYDDDEDDHSLIIRFPVLSLEARIAVEIARTHRLLLAFHEEAERSLSWNPLSQRSLVAWFEFPQEIRVPCEQYLQYFVQFLLDFGVEADSELRQHAGRVLFSVTPKDKNEGLENIREALGIYVLLPSSPLWDDSFSVGEGIVYQRLASNMLHLRSQLQLARALGQAQDATIQAQQFTIAHQQRALSGGIIHDSVVKVEPVASETEELLGGRLSLGKYETKGVGVNWAMLFRDLKQLFRHEALRKLIDRNK